MLDPECVVITARILESWDSSVAGQSAGQRSLAFMKLREDDGSFYGRWA